MPNKKEMLEEMGYVEEKKKKPKEEKTDETKVSKDNPSVNKNSQLGEW